MALLFLIPILVCGYYFLINSRIHKYKIKKIEGQQLYFKCALYGLVFTATGFLATSYLISAKFYVFGQTISLGWLQKEIVDLVFYAINLEKLDINNSIQKQNSVLQESRRNIGFYSFFLLAFLISIFLTIFWNYLVQGIAVARDILSVFNRTLPLQYIRAFFQLLKRLFKKFYLYLRHQLHLEFKLEDRLFPKVIEILKLNDILKIWNDWKYGISGIKKEIKNPIDSLLYESIALHQSINNDLVNTQLIMLTMNDRKVYIGIVIGFGKDNDVFSVSNETFYFLPVKSGYRNKYDLRISITTNYSQAIKDAVSLSDIQIVLNKNSIISACKFDDKRFESFNNLPKFFGLK